MYGIKETFDDMNKTIEDIEYLLIIYKYDRFDKFQIINSIKDLDLDKLEQLNSINMYCGYIVFKGREWIEYNWALESWTQKSVPSKEFLKKELLWYTEGVYH